MSEKEYGNAGPMGLTAFAATAFMLGVFNAGLLHKTGMPIVLDMALLYGGLLQIICAVLEIVGGNTFVATVFGTYGSLWVTYGAFGLWFEPMIPKVDIPSAVALFLAMFAVATLYFFVASFKTTWMHVIIFGLVLIALVLLVLGAALGIESLDLTAGWLTIIFSVLTWYLAASQLIASTWGREILPLGHIK
jgi:succinate-acetate transporter protein